MISKTLTPSLTLIFQWLKVNLMISFGNHYQIAILVDPFRSGQDKD